MTRPELANDLFNNLTDPRSEQPVQLGGRPENYLLRHVVVDLGQIPQSLTPEVTDRYTRVGDDLVLGAYDENRPEAIRQAYPAESLVGVAASLAKGIFDREHYEIEEAMPWMGQSVNPETGRLGLRVNDLVLGSGRLALAKVRLAYVDRKDFQPQRSGEPGLSWESKPGVDEVPVLAVSRPMGVDTLERIADTTFLPTDVLADSFGRR